MTDTARLGLTLLEAAQAQKHVTMNEALARIDALTAGRVEALSRADPPTSPADGTLWGIGSGATGEWAGQDGRMAIAIGGGWSFADPWDGWRLWDAETGGNWIRVSSAWVSNDGAGGTTSQGGAATHSRITEIDHAVGSGTSSATGDVIPDKAIVLGVTARVLTSIGGASSFSIGVAGAADRYGTGFGTAAGSFAEGVTGQPLAYFGGTPLVLTAAGGSFSGGTVRLAVHYLAISAPVPA